MNPLQEQAQTTFTEAMGYIKTLEKSMIKQSRFNNDLLYSMAAMSFEKLFVSFLANHGINAMHHTPMALFKEANSVNQLPDTMKETAKLLSKFESICSFDGFGYKTPQTDELNRIINGLVEIRDYVGECLTQE